MPQPFLIASFRVFPSQRSRTPLEAASFLVVIHPRLVTNCSRPYRLRFPRRPRPKTQLPGSPEDYGLPFGRPKPTFPVPLDLAQRSRHAPPASPTSKPCSLCKSVHASPSEPEPTADPLLDFCPFREPSRTSEPRTRPVPRSWTRAITRRLQRATPGTAAPDVR
jgi:hypothetical protein